MRCSLYCNYRFSSLYEWESMAALLTVHRKRMTFGALGEVALNSNQTNSCVSTMYSIAPPQLKKITFCYNFWTLCPKNKIRSWSDHTSHANQNQSLTFRLQPSHYSWFWNIVYYVFCYSSFKSYWKKIIIWLNFETKHVLYGFCYSH